MSSLFDTIASRFSRRAEADAGDITAAALRSDRFRQAREADWKRLEAIVTAMEKGRLARLSDEDILDLPVLYRTVASSLSVAREISLDAATLAYLEALVQRAWFFVYGPRQNFAAWLRGFFAGGWSHAVRTIGPDILIALAVMVAGVLVGWLLVAQDPQWYGALVPGETVRTPAATREALHATLFGSDKQDGLAVFATYLFGHNAQIAIMAYAVGFAAGIPSVLLLVQNTGNLGAMLCVFHQKGLLIDFIGWLSIHGTTELFAILLAGASGIHVGRAMAFPGQRSVMSSMAVAGRRTAPVMLGVVLMLLVAGLLEGFARQLVQDTPMRLAVGGAMLLFWLNYFFTFARRGERA